MDQLARRYKTGLVTRRKSAKQFTVSARLDNVYYLFVGSRKCWILGLYSRSLKLKECVHIERSDGATISTTTTTTKTAMCDNGR